MRVIATVVSVPDVKSLQALGDAIRERLKTGVAALGRDVRRWQEHCAGGRHG
jgi:hypothetical protein